LKNASKNDIIEYIRITTRGWCKPFLK